MKKLIIALALLFAAPAFGGEIANKSIGGILDALGGGDPVTLTTPDIGAATGTSLDLGGTILYSGTAITVDTGGNLNISLGSAAGDDFTVDGTKLVVEGDTGNVGIGTASPDALLHLYDTNSAVTPKSGTVLTIEKSSAAYLSFITPNTVGAAGILWGDPEDDDVGSILYGQSDNDMEFTTNGNIRMQIDSSGNVGIGTTPAENLHIFSSTDNAQLELESTFETGIAQVILTADSGGNSQINFADESDSNIGWIQYIHPFDSLNFRTNDDTRMTIDSSGNVGIGTTAPDAALEVNHATGDNMRLTYNDSDGSASNYADLQTTSSGDLSVNASSGNIDTNGNRLIQSQSIADLTAGKAEAKAYWFDGTDDYVSVADDADLDFGTNDFSIVVSLMNPDVSSGVQYVMSKFEDSDNSWFLSLTHYGAGDVYFTAEENGNTTSINCPAGTAQDGEAAIYGVIYNADSASDSKIYKNGKVVSTSTTGSYVGNSLDNSGVFYISKKDTNYVDQAVYRYLQFNLALDATDATDEAIINGGPVPYKYQGASQTDLVTSSFENGSANPYSTFDGASSSGFHVVGSAGDGYSCSMSADEISTIKGKVYAVDFDVSVAVGAGTIYVMLNTGELVSSASNVESFSSSGHYRKILTATKSDTCRVNFYTNVVATEYTVSNISLTQIGCVADYSPDGITQNYWFDKSGNGLNGTVSGAQVVGEQPPAVVGSFENLLTNSGFGVWSNSEDLYTTEGDAVGAGTLGDATDLAVNGSFTSGDTGWTKGTGWTIADQGGGDYEAVATNVDAGIDIYQAYASFEVGKLYELTITCTNYTDGGVRAAYYSGGYVYGNSLTGPGTSTVVFEAIATSGSIMANITTNGTDLRIDDIQLHEVTPGIVSATTDGPDGWTKNNSTNMKIYREHNGTNTKEGAFYSVKIIDTVGSATNSFFWPNNSTYNIESHYSRFAGRTVTFGAWVKAAAVSDVKLRIADGISNSNSSANNSTDWEWLEVTKDVSSEATSFFTVILLDGAATAYISQPQLSFCSHLGEGNYTQPPGEIVWLESQTMIVDVASLGATDDYTINLESASDGKLPKGAVSANFYIYGTPEPDTGNALGIRNAASLFLCPILENNVASVRIRGTGWNSLLPNGDPFIDIANGTWTNVAVDVGAVQVAP
jgi:hypothetical protein